MIVVVVVLPPFVCHFVVAVLNNVMVFFAFIQNFQEEDKEEKNKKKNKRVENDWRLQGCKDEKNYRLLSWI